MAFMKRAVHRMVWTDNTLQKQAAADNNKEFRTRTACIYIPCSSLQKIPGSRLPEYYSYKQTLSDVCRNQNFVVRRYLPYFEFNVKL
jgi:hypothetical protein